MGCSERKIDSVGPAQSMINNAYIEAIQKTLKYKFSRYQLVDIYAKLLCSHP